MSKIVLIEDEKAFMEAWHLSLIKEGFEIEHFPTASHFFKKQPTNFEIIIVDRLSPGYDAVEDNFPEQVKELYPLFKGPIILCSVLNRIIEKGSFGFDLFVTKKPISLRKTLDEYEIF